MTLIILEVVGTCVDVNLGDFKENHLSPVVFCRDIISPQGVLRCQRSELPQRNTVRAGFASVLRHIHGVRQLTDGLQVLH